MGGVGRQVVVCSFSVFVWGCFAADSPLPVVDGPRLWTLDVRLTAQGDFLDPPVAVPAGEVACQGLPGDTLTLSASVIDDTGRVQPSPDVLWLAAPIFEIRESGLPDDLCDGFPIQGFAHPACRLGRGGSITTPVEQLPLVSMSSNVHTFVTAFGAVEAGVDAEDCAARFLSRDDLGGCFVAERGLAMGPEWHIVRALGEANETFEVAPEDIPPAALNEEVNLAPRVLGFEVNGSPVSPGDRVQVAAGQRLFITPNVTTQDFWFRRDTGEFRELTDSFDSLWMTSTPLPEAEASSEGLALRLPDDLDQAFVAVRVQDVRGCEAGALLWLERE